MLLVQDRNAIYRLLGKSETLQRFSGRAGQEGQSAMQNIRAAAAGPTHVREGDLLLSRCPLALLPRTAHSALRLLQVSRQWQVCSRSQAGVCMAGVCGRQGTEPAAVLWWAWRTQAL